MLYIYLVIVISMYHYYVIMDNNVYCIFIITFILLVLVLGKNQVKYQFLLSFFILPDIKANLFILVVLVQDVKTLALATQST